MKTAVHRHGAVEAGVMTLKARNAPFSGVLHKYSVRPCQAGYVQVYKSLLTKLSQSWFS